MAALSAFGIAEVAVASTNGVVISEFRARGPVGGNDEYVEIRNAGANAVSIQNWILQGCSSGTPGNASNRVTVTAAITLQPGQSFLFANTTSPGYSATVAPNLTYGTGFTDFAASNFAGIRLVDAAGAIVDQVGSPQSPCREGTGFSTPTTNGESNSFERVGGTQDTDNNVADFAGPKSADPQRWEPPVDQAPTVASTSPSGGATGVARDANVTVTFSEPVLAGADAFQIVCATSGAHAASVSGGPTTYTVDPSTDFATLENCTVTVVGARVSDLDVVDPPDAMAADHTFSFQIADVFACGEPATRIHAIQGATSTAALTGSRTIEGVVVGDYQGAGQFNGYFVQEEVADQDTSPLTSEGIFVFSGSVPGSNPPVPVDNVDLGDVVRVRGTAGESFQMTQLSNITALQKCGRDSVPATPVSLPVASVSDHERFEGMLVRYDQTLTVTEVFNLGRFGEVSLSGVGRLYHPTASAAPGPDSLAVDVQNDRSRIVLDDADNRQNIDPTVYPQGGLSATNTLRVGDSLDGLMGVLEFRFSAYRIQPVGPIAFQPTNPRPAAPAAVGGNLKVASFNVLNYFDDWGCGDRCRGANNQFEFGRQEAKIVSALKAIDADIVGLMEIENDGGPGNALSDLTAALNAATATGTYAYIDTGVIGTDAIKVALIYKPGKVSPIGAWDILTSADDPRFVDTRSRPALAQTFRHLSSGEVLTVAVNHLKSKGSSCGGAPDDQPDPLGGNCNGTRTLAAAALADWLNGDPTGSGDPDALIIGDLNAYTFETPIQELEARGFTNMVRQFQGLAAYSYVFSGESGYLDHALANAALRPQVTGVTEWHINPDEPTVLDYNENVATNVFKTPNQVQSFYDSGPYRSSDHDPVIVGLQLNHAPTASAGGPYSVAEGGSVTVTATGADVDGDTLTYAWDLDDDGDFDDATTAAATFSAAAIDGPATRTIRIRVSDGAKSAVATATVTVTNVAPTATFTAPASAPAGFPFTIALTGATDPSAADQAGLQYAFDCGGGHGAFGAATTATCVANSAGPLVVRAKVRDDDGGVTEYSRTVQVTVTFASLCELVQAYSDKEGVANALCAKLETAAAKAARKDQDAELRAFVNQVEAQAGKAFTNDEAATLIRLAGNL